jgi:nucleotide-binding universal stress UspA family protein
VNATLVRAGEPAYEVLRLAEEGQYDLILMGTHGRTGLGRVLIGSVAEKISRLAKQPVLTFHVPKEH